MTSSKEINIWVKALLLILEEGDKEKMSQAAGRLVLILQKKKKGYLLPKIIEKLEKTWERKNKLELFLAREHSEKHLADLGKNLFLVLGKEKKVEVKIKEDLIGGFLAKTDKLLIKASVKDFLDEIKNNYLLSN